MAKRQMTNDEIDAMNNKSYWYVYLMVLIIYCIEIPCYIITINSAVNQGAIANV